MGFSEGLSSSPLHLPSTVLSKCKEEARAADLLKLAITLCLAPSPPQLPSSVTWVNQANLPLSKCLEVNGWDVLIRC